MSALLFGVTFLGFLIAHAYHPGYADTAAGAVILAGLRWGVVLGKRG